MEQGIIVESNGFNRLVEIMRRLRAPGGCPWDAEQTHDSLKRYLVEECYEVIEAIDNNDAIHLKEELGDLLLQPVFHGVIAEQTGQFTIDEIIDTVCAKLIRRHPHVFGSMEIRNSEEQIENWDKIKQSEKKAPQPSLLSGLPPDLPALLKAQKITEKAARVGFDWEKTEHVIEKVQEEMEELSQAIKTGNTRHIKWELGDLLFAIVNLGRFLDVNSEDALRESIGRFTRRFSHIEETMRNKGIDLQDATLEEMEILWHEAKSIENKV